MTTDDEWRKWGEVDPYFGVLSTQEFREGGNRDEFFAAGERHLSGLIETFASLGLPLQPNGRAVDFGCGVGRVLGPMSRYFGESLGVDVAPGMLAEAVRNAPDAQLCQFDGKDLGGALEAATFTFVHSVLVLQHITPARGLGFLDELLSRMVPGGVALIQAPFAPKHAWRHYASQALKANATICKTVRFLTRRPRPFDPVMQMHLYGPTRLIPLFRRHGLEVRTVKMSPDGNLWQGAWYLHKSPERLPS